MCPQKETGLTSLSLEIVRTNLIRGGSGGGGHTRSACLLGAPAQLTKVKATMKRRTARPLRGGRVSRPTGNGLQPVQFRAINSISGPVWLPLPMVLDGPLHFPWLRTTRSSLLMTGEAQSASSIRSTQEGIPSLKIFFVRIMNIVAGRALDLISLKGLDPIGEHAAAVGLENGGLIEARIKVIGGEADGEGMVVPQILREVSDRGVVGPVESAIGPFQPVMALAAGIASCVSLKAHAIVGACFDDVMILRRPQYRIDRHRAIMAGETGQ